jgi:hypothetical protein
MRNGSSLSDKFKICYFWLYSKHSKLIALDWSLDAVQIDGLGVTQADY